MGNLAISTRVGKCSLSSAALGSGRSIDAYLIKSKAKWSKTKLLCKKNRIAHFTQFLRNDISKINLACTMMLTTLLVNTYNFEYSHAIIIH